MKAFDLEKALAGEPVMLKDGSKAFVKFSVPIEPKENNFADIVGFKISGNEFVVKEWDSSGVARFAEHCDSIVGMWEEPRPTVTLTLPCPLKKIEQGQRVYFLNQGNFLNPIGSIIFNEDHICDCQLFKNGGLFANKQDAQAWLDAMRDSRR